MTGSSGLLLDLGTLMRVRTASQDPVVVEFLHLRRHQRVFISALTLCELTLGELTLGELAKDALGPAELPPQKSGDPELSGWLRELTERFAANILPVDYRTALACQHAAAGQVERTRIPAVPAILAATALHHRLTVVSGDPEAYAGLGVTVMDPTAAAKSRQAPEPRRPA